MVLDPDYLEEFVAIHFITVELNRAIFIVVIIVVNPESFVQNWAHRHYWSV